MVDFFFRVEFVPDFLSNTHETSQRSDEQSAHLNKVFGSYPLWLSGYGEANSYEQVKSRKS